MKNSCSDSIRIIDVDDNNLLHWSLLLIPVFFRIIYKIF